MLARILAKARESSSLDRALFSRLVDIEEPRLQALESGEAEPTPSEVDRWAQTLGLRVKDLLAGAAEGAPMALLFSSAWTQGRPSLDEIEATGTHKILGAFLRTVRDYDELEKRLERPATSPLPTPPSVPARGLHPAEHQARFIREQLGLGIEPIPSMRRLLEERLGIPLFFIRASGEEDDLDPSMDGAATLTPRRAILVNLTSWWRMRMTLSHELAHLLLNHAHEVLFSPHRRLFKKPQRSWRWRLFEGFDDIEVHADAFAACFLAPAEGVRACVGEKDPSTECAISAVGERFGVGRTVAINRLQHVFALPQDVRAEMEARKEAGTASSYEAFFPDDVWWLRPQDIGLRSGALVPLVTEALQAKKIGKVRAWECLGLPLTEPAPMLPKEFQNPPVAREQQLVAAAQRYLLEHYPGRLLHALRAQRQGEQWRVELAEGGVGELELADAGILSLQDDGRVLAEDVRAASLPA